MTTLCVNMQDIKFDTFKICPLAILYVSTTPLTIRIGSVTIYIYVCVCVCVCVFILTYESLQFHQYHFLLAKKIFIELTIKSTKGSFSPRKCVMYNCSSVKRRNDIACTETISGKLSSNFDRNGYTKVYRKVLEPTKKETTFFCCWRS